MGHGQICRVGVTAALVLILAQVVPVWAAHYRAMKIHGNSIDWLDIDCSDPSPFQWTKRQLESGIREAEAKLSEIMAKVQEAARESLRAQGDYNRAVQSGNWAAEKEADERFRFWTREAAHWGDKELTVLTYLNQLRSNYNFLLDNYHKNCDRQQDGQSGPQGNGGNRGRNPCGGPRPPGWTGSCLKP